jgi:phosphoribosylaminoimidazolecarboxamide formyltransferase/IMP cyclohydrolase
MALNIVRTIDDLVPVKNIIVSVYDKSGVDVLVKGMLEIIPQAKIFATGNTYNFLREVLMDKAKTNLISIASYTGQPEMQGGLVKTLDFKLYLGLLSETYNQAHQDDLNRVQGVAFDMLVSNVYPFQEAIKGENVTPEVARSYIDIGGPCMIRAAAKNFLRVAAVTEQRDYPMILTELEQNKGKISLSLRYELAKKAFLHIAQYDTAISEYLINLEFSAAAACYTIAKTKEE